jgi:hypothetical protein
MTDNSQSMILVSSSNTDPSNMIQQKSKYLLTTISQKLTRKLFVIAIFNILIGIVSIVIDVRLMYDTMR